MQVEHSSSYTHNTQGKTRWPTGQQVSLACGNMCGGDRDDNTPRATS